MLEVDVEKFWAADKGAHDENCFSKKSTQVAMGIGMSDECVFAELNEPGEPWGITERERRIYLNKNYNDIAEKVVGKRLLREEFLPEDAKLPAIKQIGEIFGGSYDYVAGTLWLHSDICSESQLEKQLDKIDKMNFEEFVLPVNWESEKRRIFETYGLKPSVQHHVRGPVTLATSILGPENFIYMFYDEPDLVKRLSETIEKILFKYIEVFDREAGLISGVTAKGFSFADDDCALMTPEMYEFFAFPILQKVFDKVSPNPGDSRFQHSDSDMAHLLPLLGKLNLTGCNFGPTLTVREIREHLPQARIDGQLAPFTFMRNNQETIIAEVKRDCEMAKENDLRGLNIYTAGSINNGSSLESMRAVMYAIQQYGQY